MNNDLTKCKKGDWIATIQHGWQQIERINDIESPLPIITTYANYTLSGRYFPENVAPSAFVDPPDWLLDFIGPKPCEFKKDDLVVVWEEDDDNCVRFWEYFSHMEGDKYACFPNGKTSYTANGLVHTWKYCRKAVKGEDYNA